MRSYYEGLHCKMKRRFSLLRLMVNPNKNREVALDSTEHTSNQIQTNNQKTEISNNHKHV